MTSGLFLPPAAHRVGRVLAWTVGSLLLLALVAVGWLGIRGAIAFHHMNALKADAPSLMNDAAVDPATAGDSLRRLTEHSAAARELTSDPVWRLAEGTPWIGPQLAAFRVVAASTDELLTQGVTPLVEATRQTPLETLKSQDGRLDMSVLAPLSGTVESSAAVARSAAGAVSGIDRAPLVGRVDAAVEEADALFTRSAGALDAFLSATKLLPSMLKPGEPRTYLVLVQNNAEWRSLGGISGTVIQLEWNGQTVSLGRTTSAAALTRLLPDSGPALPADIESVYQSRPGRYFQNLTQVPDFTFDGPLARDMYRAATGVEADGVLSVDPVLLSYLLTATGPVTLPTGGQLDADNAPALLMSGVYAQFSRPVDQDSYFASAASLVFGELVSARGSMPAMLSGLSRGAEEHRLLVWSADAEEQSIIEATPVAGNLPENDPETVRVGVYLNDGTGSKMSYYLRPTVNIAWSGCPARTADTRPELTMTISIASDAPADAATSLPAYVTGNGRYGVPPGSASIVGNIYLPEGLELIAATMADEASYETNTIGTHQVVTFGVLLAPQAQKTVTLVVRAPSSASHAEAWVTPTADPSLNPVVEADCMPSPAARLG